jgi:hypothetical protein
MTAADRALARPDNKQQTRHSSERAFMAAAFLQRTSEEQEQKQNDPWAGIFATINSNAATTVIAPSAQYHQHQTGKLDSQSVKLVETG